MKKKGAVLIIALWILSMLVLLAISIGRRTSIELRLLKYHLSRSQAFHLARAAIERIYAEKSTDKNENYDTLNEDWSNKLKSDGEPLFNDFPLGNGTFTLKYNQADEDYYGMRDERSKLNINKILDNDSKPIDARKKEFQNLIGKVLNNSDPETMVTNFIDWIDQDNKDVTFHNGEIQAKNSPLDRLEELTMVDGFSIADVNELADYITVYGDEKININTAPQEVLASLCCDTDDNSLGDPAAEKIIKYRNSGKDGGIKPIDSIDTLYTSNIIDEKQNKILNSRADVQSSFYKVKSQAEVRGVKKEISAVINFNQDTAPKYLYWYED